MACFTIPLAEAVVISAVERFTLRHADDKSDASAKVDAVREKIGWLKKMLYGGSFLLAIEHLYHGEISLLPPFLTAMSTPEEIPEMLHEMATVGVGMAVLTTAVWGVLVGVSVIVKKVRQHQDIVNDEA